MGQSYQEVSKLIEEDLRRLKELGVENVQSYYKKRNCRSIDIQKYYYRRKQRFPEFYERLGFDTNGHVPVSNDLSEILFDFKCSGILDLEGNIL